MDGARRGEIDTLASALTAHRVHVARLATGDVDAERSEEAEAGAKLEAYSMWDVMSLRNMYEQMHAKK